MLFHCMIWYSNLVYVFGPDQIQGRNHVNKEINLIKKTQGNRSITKFFNAMVYWSTITLACSKSVQKTWAWSAINYHTFWCIHMVFLSMVDKSSSQNKQQPKSWASHMVKCWRILTSGVHDKIKQTASSICWKKAIMHLLPHRFCSRGRLYTAIITNLLSPGPTFVGPAWCTNHNCRCLYRCLLSYMTSFYMVDCATSS